LQAKLNNSLWLIYGFLEEETFFNEIVAQRMVDKNLCHALRSPPNDHRKAALRIKVEDLKAIFY